MQFRRYHPWNLSYAEALACQMRLRRRLRTDLPLDLSRLTLVAGADVAYEPRRHNRSGDPGEPAARFVAAVVVMAFPALEIVETATAAAETTFPYIPGLLSFREGPALQLAFSKLRRRPDVVIFDGQGLAHPRGLGLAAHLGILLGLPTVGCAKSRLYGVTRGEPGSRRGNRRALVAPPWDMVTKRGHGTRASTGAASPFQPGQRIGTVLRTRGGVKPVWVSCGHMVDLRSSEQLVLRTTRLYRLPEPIRAAHRVVNAELRRLVMQTGHATH
jgi:deoxyribonuclease V